MILKFKYFSTISQQQKRLSLRVPKIKCSVVITIEVRLNFLNVFFLSQRQQVALE